MNVGSVVGDLLVHVFYALYLLSAIIIPAFFIFIFSRLWLRYIRDHFEVEQKHVLLELKLPKEILKSPAAMELFLTSLYQTGNTTYLEAYWKGKLRPRFSLELISLEGKVKFLIYTRAAFKNYIESQIYSQYPEVEIYEVPDYSELITAGEDEYLMWGTRFKKKQSDAFPIKTYLDYGLNDDPKEEHKIDPITPVLEYLGSLRSGEYAWIQIIVQAHKSEGLKEGRIFESKKEHWKESVKKEIKKIIDDAKDKETGKINISDLTKEALKTMERNMNKFPFECCIRALYMAKRSIFNSNMGISGLVGSFRQYSTVNLNSLGPTGVTEHSDFGKDMLHIFGFLTPFKRSMEEKLSKKIDKFLKHYRRRDAFLRHESFIMSTEELATIYHFPGNVAATPTFDRIQAKKAEAPSNLPT